MEVIEDYSDLGVILPIKIRKERTESQKLNDAKTSQRMKDWHQKRREDKIQKKEALDKAILELTIEPIVEPIVEPVVEPIVESIVESIESSIVKKMISKIEKKEKKTKGKPIVISKNIIECFDSS